MSLLGLGLRAWAAGHLRKEKELAISGPYRRTRNPLYLGNMIIGAGIAVGAWSWGSLAVLIVYFFIFYPVVIREERDRMRRLFPEAYKSYEKHVPLFFMGFRKNGHSDATAFSWELYRKNKETRALIGTAVFWAVLVCSHARLTVPPLPLPAPSAASESVESRPGLCYNFPMPTDRRIERITDVLSHRQPDLRVVLEGVTISHNASAVIRTCDAAGVLYLDLISPNPDLLMFNEAITTRADKWLEIGIHSSTADCLQRAEKPGIRDRRDHAGG